MRALIALIALLVVVDPILFDRSVVHLLVGHSVVVLGLLLLMLFVESAGNAAEETVPASPASRIVPALGVRVLTPLYDLVVGATTREARFKRALIEQASIRPGHNVLDLACGTGTLALWLAQAHPSARVTGIDADPDILRRARRKLDRANATVQLDLANSGALPYPDRTFDRVVTSLFFHHLKWSDKQQTACEVLRVLKPGGELHIADWGRPRNVLMRWLFFPVQVLDGFENTRDHVLGRLVELLREAGYDQVAERDRISTMFGTLALYSAVRPG